MSPHDATHRRANPLVHCVLAPRPVVGVGGGLRGADAVTCAVRDGRPDTLRA